LCLTVRYNEAWLANIWRGLSAGYRETHTPEARLVLQWRGRAGRGGGRAGRGRARRGLRGKLRFG